MIKLVAAVLRSLRCEEEVVVVEAKELLGERAEQVRVEDS